MLVPVIVCVLRMRDPCYSQSPCEKYDVSGVLYQSNIPDKEVLILPLCVLTNIDKDR
jgi:hypothetical protein